MNEGGKALFIPESKRSNGAKPDYKYRSKPFLTWEVRQEPTLCSRDQNLVAVKSTYSGVCLDI